MRCAFACGLVLFVSGMRILAQNPLELARSYLETLQAGKYDDVSAFFAADELKEFRATFDFGEALPQEAAQQFYLMLFGEGATKSSVHKLSDTQFFSGFLSFVLKRIGAAGELTFDKLEVLGEVPEGDSVVHVLVRSRLLAGELETESLEVISFKKVGENWKGMLSKKIKGIAAQLRKGFE